MDLTAFSSNRKVDLLTLSQKEDLAMDYTLVDFIGEMDSSSLPKAKEFISQLFDNLKTKNLILNFVNLKYVNSESIGYLFQINEALVKQNKKLTIIGAKKNVFDVLSVIGLFDSVGHFNSLLDFIRGKAS